MKTNDKIIYEGFFLTASKGFKGSLEKEIENKHITTDFFGSNSDKPTHPKFYGMEVTFEITGYANDGKNEGFLIDKNSLRIENYCPLMFDGPKYEISLVREFVKFYYETMKDRIPHITLSVAKDGKPVDTKDLEFEPVRNSFTCHAVFAGYTDKGELTDKEKIHEDREEISDASKFTKECQDDYDNADNDFDDDVE